MRMYLLALNPTDSVTDGFLPAAGRLGLSVTVLTDSPRRTGRRTPDGTSCPRWWSARCTTIAR